MRRRRRALGAFLAAAGVAAAGVTVLASGNDGSASNRDRPSVAQAPDTTARRTPVVGGTATVRREYGKGASAVAVVRPQVVSGALPGVLFLHGWGYQRPRDYRPWIKHLARDGNAVIVPKYQNGPHSDPAGVRGAMLRGLRTALSHVALEKGSLVVAGHSAGAAMGADYAAIARSLGLPRPRAVYAVYPGRRIIGTPGIPAADPARIAASTRLLVLAGARDVIVGQAPARELTSGATSIPAARRRLVLVQGARVSDHLAPLRSSSAARRTFWRRLDRLIDAARQPAAP